MTRYKISWKFKESKTFSNNPAWNLETPYILEINAMADHLKTKTKTYDYRVQIQKEQGSRWKTTFTSNQKDGE